MSQSWNNSKRKKGKRAPVTAASLVGSALQKYGLSDAVNRYEFVDHWPEIVGEGLADKTFPEGLQADALVVRVPSSVWAQEMSLYKNVILERLKAFTTPGAREVRDLRFTIGDPAKR